MSGRTVHVVAGVLFDASGRVLVARRPGGTHLAGLWEFPGGKLAPGESREAGLARELAEELGVRTLAASPLIWVEHRYPDREVVLDVWRVESYSGTPYGREGQPIAWRDVRSLDAEDFPPADVPVLAALQLPRRYLVTPEPGDDWSAFLDRLAVRVAEGFELIQLRAKSLEEPELIDLGARAASICRRGGARLLVNANREVARRCGAHGVHLTSERLTRESNRRSEAGATANSNVVTCGMRSDPYSSESRPPDVPSAGGGDSRRPGAAGAARASPRLMVGASCHDAGDLARARAAGCDFAVLGPVQETASHPGAAVLGWRGFERLARGAGLPVFAIGGLGDDDISAAASRGGQGTAAIRAFWGGD